MSIELLSERTLLENLQMSRQRSGVRKTVDSAAVEQRLETLCRIQGEAELNRLRENAKTLAASIEMKPEYDQLDEMIGAILGTRSNDVLKTASARARAQGLPYDSERLERFMSLHAALRSTVLPIRQLTETPTILRNIAFFDAYFSNYIEGTEFEPEEAEDIVFKNRPLKHRHEDSHDIIATYNIVSNTLEMCSRPVAQSMPLSLSRRKEGSRQTCGETNTQHVNFSFSYQRPAGYGSPSRSYFKGFIILALN
ncbi:MAG: hypothetical protein ABFS56_32155 [Pseudomonadota bacterium]